MGRWRAGLSVAVSAVVVIAGGGSALGVQVPPKPVSDVRAKIPVGMGSGKRAVVPAPPAAVLASVAKKRFTAPAQVLRTVSGKAPSPELGWSEAGSQSTPVEGVPGTADKNGGDATLTPQAAAGVSVDEDVAAPGLGIQDYYGIEEFGVREGLSLGVNVGNGNLTLRDTDLKINAPGVATRSDRFYNGLSSRWGMFGKYWSYAGGQDVGLEIAATSVVFRGPSGFRATFTGSGSTWTAPAGLNATLVKNADRTWKLKQKKSGITMTFTEGGYLLTHTDRNGVGLRFAYASTTLTSITDAAGRVTTFASTDGRVTKMTDSSGRAYTYTYNTGRLDTSTTPDGNATKYSYDYYGRLSFVQTARGVRVQVGYETTSNTSRVSTITRYTDYNGAGTAQTTTFAYPSSTSTTQKDARGNTWTYTKDAAGRVTKVSDPLGRVRSQSWRTANSAIQTSTDAMGAGGTGGNQTTYSYDSANNATQVQSPMGAYSSAVYSTGGACGSTDAANPDLPKCITDNAGNSKAMTYDALGNLTSTADNTGGSTTGSKLTYTYQRAAGATTGADCGGKPGQRCTAKDGNNNTTSYRYDSDGNMSGVTPPAPLGGRAFEYDSLGRLTASTNGRGQRLTYVYDNQDRLLQTNIPAGSGSGARTIAVDYDVDGNVTFNDSTITYDAQNRQASVKDQQSSSPFTTAYDAAGNVTGISGPNYATKYSFDAANQNVVAGWADAACTVDSVPQAGCVKFIFDNNGLEKYRFLPSATVVRTFWDASSRISQMQTVTGRTALYDQSYSYLKAGTTGAAGDRRNIQSVTHTLGVQGSINTGSVTSYGYDSMDRLTSAVEKTAAGGTNASWAYGYDKASNRTSQTRMGSTQAQAGTLSYGYNAASQLTSINGSSSNLAYDADGNETKAAGDDWVNVPRRDSTVSPYGDVTNMTTDTGNYSFGYAGVNPGQYLLTQAHGMSIQRSPLGEAFTTDADGNTISFLRGPNGKALGYRVDGQNAYFVPDRQGSTLGVLNDSAAKVVSYGYDPYGNIRSAPGLDIPMAWANTVTYIGAMRDLQTGLYRLGVRWYDPNTGRFTTPDPTSQETNPYTYAAANPVTFIDPTGGSAEWGAGIGGTIGAAAATFGVGVFCAVSGGLGCAVAAVVGGAVGTGIGASLGASAGGASKKEASAAGLSGFVTGALGGALFKAGALGIRAGRAASGQ